MKTQNNLRWWQYDPNSEKQKRLVNRAYGLTAIVLGGIFVGTGDIGLDIISIPFFVEGAGDLISGEHHYLGSRAISYIFPNLGRDKT